MSAFFAFLGIACIAWYFRGNLLARIPGRTKKAPRFPKGCVLVYDGTMASWKDCELTHLGVQVSKDEVYPVGVCDAYPIPGTKPVRYLWIAGIEKQALADHMAMEAGRATILVGSLFKPGGDIIRALQIAALVVPLVASIWMTLQVNSNNARMNALGAEIAIVRENVEKLTGVKP